MNGRVAGVWDLSEGQPPAVKLLMFGQPDRKVLRLVEQRALAMGEFVLDRAVALEMCDGMVPLTQRNAGEFTSPLAPPRGRRPRR